MKIVDRATFLALPRGTLYTKFSTSGDFRLQIKLDTFGTNDWVYRDPLEILASGSDELFDMIMAVDDGAREDLPLDWHVDMSRDGLYEAARKFAVLDRSEVAMLIGMLVAVVGSGS